MKGTQDKAVEMEGDRDLREQKWKIWKNLKKFVKSRSELVKNGAKGRKEDPKGVEKKRKK